MEGKQEYARFLKNKPRKWYREINQQNAQINS
jgi:hypothetical protein